MRDSYFPPYTDEMPSNFREVLATHSMRKIRRIFLLCSFASLIMPGLGAERTVSTITGLVVDKSGAAVVGASLKLAGPAHSVVRETLTDGNGQFSFADVEAGTFDLTVTSKGFAAKHETATVIAGENASLPQIVLEVAALKTDVQVSGKQTMLAEEQIKEQEQQRLFGLVPNYRVSYLHEAVPLVPKQKFELSWKMTLDPAAFVIAGIIAGVQQAENTYKGYGQGAQGYGKRYGAAYADFFIGTMLSEAILPSVFHQDPRYFVKGEGSGGSRALYAIANSVICKGDNGRWQPRYAEILGGLAAGGISNLYIPAKDRNGASTTFQNAAIGIGGDAIGNLFQEFLSKKLTRKKHK